MRLALAIREIEEGGRTTIALVEPGIGVVREFPVVSGINATRALAAAYAEGYGAGARHACQRLATTVGALAEFLQDPAEPPTGGH